MIRRDGSALTSGFDEPLWYASRAHATQTRTESDVVYSTHLARAMTLVLEHGGGEDEAIAPLLHHAVDDQGRPASPRGPRGAHRRRVAPTAMSSPSGRGVSATSRTSITSRAVGSVPPKRRAVTRASLPSAARLRLQTADAGAMING